MADEVDGFERVRDSRIYVLEAGEGEVVPGGPVLIGPGGEREEIPPLVYRALQHVVEAMRAGKGVKIVPLRLELPIDEAADAIGMARDDLRAYVARGAVPFRSSQYVDWVQLVDVIKWDNQRRIEQRAILDEFLATDWSADEPSDGSDAGPSDGSDNGPT